MSDRHGYLLIKPESGRFCRRHPTLRLLRSYHSSKKRRSIFRYRTILAPYAEPNRSSFSRCCRPRDAPAARAPEAQLVLKSSAIDHEAIVVLIRDVQATSAHDVASMVRNVADTFSANPGGFSRLELSVCRWSEDFNAALSAADQVGACVVVIEPTGYVWDRIFLDVGRRISQSQNRSFGSRREIQARSYRH